MDQLLSLFLEQRKSHALIFLSTFVTIQRHKPCHNYKRDYSEYDPISRAPFSKNKKEMKTE